MNRHYVFDLECPRCGKASRTSGTKENPPPRVNCGDCLMDETEIVEFKIVRVHVFDGAER